VWQNKDGDDDHVHSLSLVHRNTAANCKPVNESTSLFVGHSFSGAVGLFICKSARLLVCLSQTVSQSVICVSLRHNH